MAHDCDRSRAMRTPGNMPTGYWATFSENAQLSVMMRGWQLRYIDDVGGRRKRCEMCQVERPRYIHVMDRVDGDHEVLVRRYFGNKLLIRVGCICAGWLSGYFDPYHLEKVDDQQTGKRKRKKEGASAAYEKAKKDLQDDCKCAENRSESNNAAKKAKADEIRAERLAAGPSESTAKIDDEEEGDEDDDDSSDMDSFIEDDGSDDDESSEEDDSSSLEE